MIADAAAGDRAGVVLGGARSPLLIEGTATEIVEGEATEVPSADDSE